MVVDACRCLDTGEGTGEEESLPDRKIAASLRKTVFPSFVKVEVQMLTTYQFLNLLSSMPDT